MITLRITREDEGWTIDSDASPVPDEELQAALIALLDHAIESFADELYIQRASHALCVLCSATEGDN